MRAGAAETHVPVCAIGASAGGVGALKELFRYLPDDLGLAYVVIIHLSPDQPSALDQILGGVTRLEVMQVTDRATLAPDRVYVIPPDRELVIEGDDVRARPFGEARGRRAPIDLFFRSVASGRGDGLAVILSGSGSDGSVGVRDVKEAGGVIFVQEPKTAEFPMMPRSAIAAGVADFVAPIPRLVERMAEVARSKEAVRSLSLERADHVLQQVIAFLRSRTGHDFSAYKRATVMRRVTRRMQVARCPDLGRYLEYLAANPEEAQELLGDLLISVTSFFRDRGAHEALANQVVARIFENVGDDGIRTWVAGCATGEEAYSVGILFLEEAQRRKVTVPIQIFATDLDEGALATGREGRYPASIVADVSEERLDRFFVREGVHYRVKKELRDIVLFAEHSVLKDPPFMRLNLISCRNLLIYLERELQRQVSALFAYGLKPGGYLFLGSAETTDASPELFATLDREARIYQARPQASRRLPVISRFPPDHLPLPLRDERRQASGEPERTMHAAHRDALERSAPPSVLVARDYQVLNLSDTAGRFMLPPGGPPTSDITLLVRPELRLDIRTAVRRAIDDRGTTLTPPIPVVMNGSRHRVALYVSPGSAADAGAATEALVLFLDGGPIVEPVEPAGGDGGDGGDDEVRRLREELNAAEARLATARAEHENAIQDLRVANEELQSINEEYRSTSEELETSKEELQSMNEELQTVNAELKSKLEAIGAAHSDLTNLVAATEIGTLFLDSRLRIRMLTPQVAELFNITEADVGRAVTDFTHHLVYDGLADDAALVLRDLVPVEREVETRNGRWLMMRVRPYRSVDDRIEGVVVSFFDITERFKAEAALRESEEKYRALFESIDEGFTIVETVRDDDGRLVDLIYREANGAYSRQTGFQPYTGLRVKEITPEIEEDWIAFYDQASSTGEPQTKESFNGDLRRWFRTQVSRIGPLGSPLLGIVFEDVTERKVAEIALRESEERQVFLLQLSDDLSRLSDPDDVMQVMATRIGERMSLSACVFADVDDERGLITVHQGWTADGVPGLEPTFRIADYLTDEFQRAARAGRPLIVRDVVTDPRSNAEAYARLKVGSFVVVPFHRNGRWTALFAAGATEARDWTQSEITLFREICDRVFPRIERARAEVALRESEVRLRSLLEGIPQLVWRAVDDGRWTWSGVQWSLYTGLSEAESLGYGWLDAVHAEDRERVRAVWKGAADLEAFDVECRTWNAAEDRHRWFSMRATPVRDDDGRIREWLGTATDVDDMRGLQDAQQVMVAELQHRTRNLIAVVASIARQTLAQTGPTEAFGERFGERLAALSRSQGLLSRAGSERITLGTLVWMELDALGAKDFGERVRVDGPEVTLRNSVVQTLALAVHELATNARKYGALSDDGGRLDVSWTVTGDEEPRVRLEWRECGTGIGNGTRDAGNRGYGRELIEKALPHTLDATTRFDLAEGELLCTIDLPLLRRGRRRR